MAFSKKTKIVCTMGPATESDDVLRALIENGMNVARFNFSHGSHDYHRQMIERVRRISGELSIPVAIMLDTKGPEVRTGLLEDGKKVTVNTGDTIVVTAQPTTEDFHGNAGHISLDYLNLPNEVEKGSIILIDDGLVGLEVDHVDGADIHCVVTNGGEIGEKKGVNVPNVRIARTSCLAASWASTPSLRPSSATVPPSSRFVTSASRWARLTSRSSPRSRARWASRTSTRFSRPPTASWSPVVTWASRCPRLRCPTSRRPSSASATTRTSRSSPLRRCSTR